MKTYYLIVLKCILFQFIFKINSHLEQCLRTILNNDITIKLIFKAIFWVNYKYLSAFVRISLTIVCIFSLISKVEIKSRNKDLPVLLSKFKKDIKAET